MGSNCPGKTWANREKILPCGQVCHGEADYPTLFKGMVFFKNYRIIDKFLEIMEFVKIAYLFW